MFKRVVFSIFIFFFLILTILTIVSIGKKKYVPVISNCPDYWKLTDLSNNMVSCVNDKNIGKGNLTQFNVDTSILHKSKYCQCNIKRYLKNYNVTWSGITDNHYKNCNPTTGKPTCIT
jgi:hypothetical protein